MVATTSWDEDPDAKGTGWDDHEERGRPRAHGDGGADANLVAEWDDPDTDELEGARHEHDDQD